MRICVVNQPVMARTFQDLGHEALDLRPGPGPQDLPAHLEQADFAPDLVLECEHLGPRTMLLGLGRLACPKLFWAVDVHLNAWWHEAYARQFDGLLCTQKPWTARLAEAGLPHVATLPWYGTRRPPAPWSGRDMGLCLVGRVTEHRPVRRRMVEFLAERHGLTHLDGLDTPRMLDAYDRARLVPNESIFAEVNFRLFEAASCGCVVLNQEVEGGVGHVFEPGREVLEFADILDLDRLVRRLEVNPGRAETMGRAAWERVQREHLPEHRAAAILEHAAAFSGHAPTGPGADDYAWLAMARLDDGGMFDFHVRALAPRLEARAATDPAFFADLVRCLYRGGETGALAGVLRHEVEAGRFADGFAANLAASCAALRLEDPALARIYWLRHLRATGRESLGLPEGAVALYMAWAGECERFGTDFRPGYTFAQGFTIPASAMECLLLANELDPGNLEAARRMLALASRQAGVGDFRISLLSHLTLHERGNWRLGLDLGLSNLRAMRLRQGLEELVLAREVADGQGAAGRFDSVLASREGGAALLELVRRA